MMNQVIQDISNFDMFSFINPSTIFAALVVVSVINKLQ